VVFLETWRNQAEDGKSHMDERGEMERGGPNGDEERVGRPWFGRRHRRDNDARLPLGHSRHAANTLLRNSSISPPASEGWTSASEKPQSLPDATVLASTRVG
jgi:hypothetical protein